MVKSLQKTDEHYKQNIHLIAIPNNSYDEMILKLPHSYDYITYRKQYL